MSLQLFKLLESGRSSLQLDEGSGCAMQYEERHLRLPSIRGRTFEFAQSMLGQDPGQTIIAKWGSLLKSSFCSDVSGWCLTTTGGQWMKGLKYVSQ